MLSYYIVCIRGTLIEQGNEYEGFVFRATRSGKTIVRSHVEEYLCNGIKKFNYVYAGLNEEQLAQINALVNQLISN